MRVSWSPFSSCQIHLLEIVLKHQACICGARSTPAKKARSWPQRRAGYFPQCPAAWNYTIEVNSPHKELCKLNQRHWTSLQKELFLFIFFVVFFFSLGFVEDTLLQKPWEGNYAYTCISPLQEKEILIYTRWSHQRHQLIMHSLLYTHTQKKRHWNHDHSQKKIFIFLIGIELQVYYQKWLILRVDWKNTRTSKMSFT